MADTYLRKIKATNFGCLQDVEIEFTPLHALIGPNDSGKSTVLRAVRSLTQALASAARPIGAGVDARDHGLDPEANSALEGQFSFLKFGVRASPGARFETYAEYEHGPQQAGTTVGQPHSPGFIPSAPELAQAISGNAVLRDRIVAPASLLRLDPDALRRESGLIPESQLVRFYEPGPEGTRGFGLAGVYDALMNRGDDTFRAIAKKVRELFPTVRNVRLRAVTRSDKCLEIELTNGKKVGATEMSEGLLYYLAFAALPYLAQPSILLVEEPENGLHPARIRDVVGILREVSKTTQVLVATHSPLLVNELSGDEVTVVTRDRETGTRARRLSTTPDFATRSRVYAMGELWLSYANGDDEAPLFKSEAKSK